MKKVVEVPNGKAKRQPTNRMVKKVVKVVPVVSLKKHPVVFSKPGAANATDTRNSNNG